jgi:hypothetical protein
MRDGIKSPRCCLCVKEVILVRNWKLVNVLVSVSVRAFDGTYDLTRITTAKNSYSLSILLIKLHKLPKIGIIHNLQEHLISQTI